MPTYAWATGGGAKNDQLGGYLNAAEVGDGTLDLRVDVSSGNNTLDYYVGIYDSLGNLLGYYYLYKNSGGSTNNVTAAFNLSSLGLVEGQSYTVKVFEGNTSTANATGYTYLTSGSTLSAPTGTWTEIATLQTTFVYDVTAPGAPTVSLAVDSGVAGDLITKIAGLAVSGDAGASFQYATSLGGQGNWSSAAPTPVQGVNTVYVRQVDAAGNPGAAYTTFTYTYDTQAAVLTLGLVSDSGIADGISNVGTVEVKAGLEAGATVYYSSDNINFGLAAPDFSGQVDGLKTVYAYQIDVAGNQSAIGSYSFKLDTTPPQATLAGTRFEDNGTPENPDDDYFLIDQTLTFVGTVDAGSRNVQLRLLDANGQEVFVHTLTTGGGQAELQADGNWRYDASALAALQSANGEMFTLEVSATDVAGNAGITTFDNVKVDASAPPVPSVSQFNFAPVDSKWKHDVAVLGYIGDVVLSTDPSARVEAWIKSGGQRLYDQFAVYDPATGKHVWSPTLNPGSGERISLATLYQSLEFSLAAVDEAGNVITIGNGPNAKPAIVDCVYGAHAVQYGDDPNTLDVVETNFVLNNINDNLVGSNGYDDLVVGYNGDDTINGQAGNDFLYGGQGRDAITGAVGNDEIVGGTQADLLDGGLGLDRFVYSRFNESNISERDRIVNFTAAEGDVVDVSELCRALGIVGSFNASYTYGSEGAVFTKVKGKTTASNAATKGEFWLGNDGVIFGNLDNNIGAEFSVALVTPVLGDNPATPDVVETDFISYNPIADVSSMRSHLAAGGLDVVV